MKSSIRSYAIGVLTFALATTTSASNGTAQTNAMYTINLAAYGSGIGPWCVYAAQDQNFFSAAGVHVDSLLSISGDPNLVSALTSGQVDVALAAAATIVPVANGQTDQLVVIAADENSATALVVDDSITKASQLAGKTIAINAKSTGTEVVGSAQINDLVGKGKWTPLYLGGGEGGRLVALQTGRVAAAYVSDPADIANLGHFHILTRFGGRKRYNNGPLVATRNWLKSHPDAAVHFLTAFARGCNYILDPKNRSNAIALLAKNKPVRDAVAAESYDYYVTGPSRGQTPPRDAKLDLPAWVNAVQALKDEDVITNKDFDARSVIDMSYLERALKALHGR
jgi:ABC-type nitrate/sulfonate/bicarbonate transport system substrate-binding protein